MTREGAIDIIKSECYVFNPLNFDRSTMVNTALDMAVKALKQEPCDEAVSRSAVLDEILKFSVTDGRSVSVTGLWTEVNDLPLVIPQPKMGRWIKGDSYGDQYNYYQSYVCSCCKRCYDVHGWNYCPNCGAKMESEERNEEI